MKRLLPFVLVLFAAVAYGVTEFSVFAPGNLVGGQADATPGSATDGATYALKLDQKKNLKVTLVGFDSTTGVSTSSPLPVSVTSYTATGLQYANVNVTNTPTVDTELPAAAALADNAANPTTPLVGATLLAYDGSTWDRVTNGNGTAAAALRVTVASDSTGVIGVTQGTTPWVIGPTQVTNTVTVAGTATVTQGTGAAVTAPWSVRLSDGTSAIGTSALPVTVTVQGPANVADSQVSVTTSSTLLFAARTTRCRLLVTNTDATNVVWISATNAATTANSGIRLKAGESAEWTAAAGAWAIAVGGTCVTTVHDEYN